MFFPWNGPVLLNQECPQRQDQSSSRGWEFLHLWNTTQEFSRAIPLPFHFARAKGLLNFPPAISNSWLIWPLRCLHTRRADIFKSHTRTCRMHLFSGAFLSPLGKRHRCSHTWKPVLTQTASGDWWLRGNPDWESWIWTLLLPLTRSGKVNCNSLCLSFHIYNAHMLNGRIKRTLKTIWNNKYNKKTLYFRIKQICL